VDESLGEAGDVVEEVVADAFADVVGFGDGEVSIDGEGGRPVEPPAEVRPS
jgi:hypothetical protein